MNLRLLSGPELWIVFGVLFLMGCAVLVLLMRDESDFGRADRVARMQRLLDEDRRQLLKDEPSTRRRLPEMDGLQPSGIAEARGMAERDRRRQLDAATETPLEPIRKHALLERRKR